MVKILCNKKHVEFKDGKFDMDDPETKDLFQEIINKLEYLVRIQIHNEICDLKLTENRKQIVANGIDNVALTVQDLCARIALGKINEAN